jgi:hypothetical protein
LFPIKKVYLLNFILMQIDPLTICSVDVRGRREMRSFFDGIVRLQVCVTLAAMYFCFGCFFLATNPTSTYGAPTSLHQNNLCYYQ